MNTIRCAAAAAILAAAGSAAPAAELLENRFVDNYHGYSSPYSWIRLGGAASTVNEDPAFAVSGRNSMEMRLANGSAPEWVQLPVPVAPGEELLASAQYRIDQAFSNGHAAILVRFFSGPDRQGFISQVAIADNIGPSTTSGWVLAEGGATVPPGAAYADLALWAGGASGPQGIARFDAVSLRTAPLASPAASSPSPANGEESVQIYRVLSATPNIAGATDARLYFSEDRLEVASAAPGAAAFFDEFPIGSGQIQYGMTLRPYRRYFWRIDLRDSGGVWHQGDAWSFSTGFHVVEDAVSINTRRFDAKDNRNLGLDAMQIIPNPAAPGYIGVYHNIPLGNGQFDIAIGTSTNLLTWTFRGAIAPNSSMPAIAYLPSTGGFLFAHEQWGNPLSISPSNLRFRYYPDYDALLALNPSRDFTAPIAPFNPSNLEGTPHFQEFSADGNSIEIGFHYFQSGVDRLAKGTLTNLVSGTTSWTRQIDTERNNMLIGMDVVANIGDRDRFDLYGNTYILQEGQYIVNDFGSWRAFFLDPDRNQYFPLMVRTPLGSRNFGNMTAKYMALPGGARGVVSAYFIFSEQGMPGEAGQLIFFHSLPEAPTTPFPASNATAESTNPRVRWIAGAGNVQWEVYLGTTFAAVNNATTASPEFQGIVDRPLAQFDSLPPFTTHFWRVEAILPDGSRARSGVWNFQTPAEDTRVGDWMDFR